jgi:hypothetical protein
MENITRKSDSSQPAAETAVYLFDDWFDPIEAGVRDRVREFIQAMVEGELDAALMRPRYGRRSQSSSGDADGPVGVTGHRHGHRSRSLMGTFGRTEIAVPRARLDGPDGQTTEWKSKMLRAYQRRTLAADALIASTYLAGTNTRRVRRALAALFGGAVGKDTVSPVWRKVKADWEAWNARSLAEEPIVRLILDGTVVLSDQGKRMLAEAGIADVGMAAPADMFELGVKLQVLNRGTMFSVRANKLYELYRDHASLEAIPAVSRGRAGDEDPRRHHRYCLARDGTLLADAIRVRPRRRARTPSTAWRSCSVGISASRAAGPSPERAPRPAAGDGRV